LLRYRVRPASMYRSAVRRDAHIHLMDRLYRKHLDTLHNHAEALLLAKERFILEQRSHQAYLLGLKRELESQLELLHSEIDDTVRQLHTFGRDRVEFPDLRTTRPISPVWGLDRGIPLDRHYIQSFLERHRVDVAGRVLEIKDPGYTRMFG